jgi:hypothetical protein
MVFTLWVDCLDALEAIKDNDEAVKAYGIQLGAEMCKHLLDAGKILEAVGVLDTSKVLRSLPWRQVPSTRILASCRSFAHRRRLSCCCCCF